MVAVQLTNGVYFEFSSGDGSQSNPYKPGAVPQSGDWNITNITGTVSLPNGAATAANQAFAIASLADIDSKLTAGIPITSFINAALQTETALTTAGSTPAKGLVMAGYSKASYQIDIANIGTNVVVRVEGSNDGTGWANLSGDQTLTANGTYMLSTDGIAAGYVRLTLVSLSGGTPSVTGKLLRAN